jgi:hypothetical protein
VGWVKERVLDFGTETLSLNRPYDPYIGCDSGSPCGPASIAIVLIYGRSFKIIWSGLTDAGLYSA